MAAMRDESNRIGNLPTSPDRSKFDELKEIEIDKAEELMDAEVDLKKKIKRKKTPEEIQAAQDELATARREAQRAQRQVEAERALLVSQVIEIIPINGEGEGEGEGEDDHTFILPLARSTTFRSSWRYSAISLGWTILN